MRTGRPRRGRLRLTWLPSRFPYQGIVDELRASILEGRLEDGERLPSENELAERYGTSRPTVRRAIALLKAEGLVNTEQGRGAFVSAEALMCACRFRETRSVGIGARGVRDSTPRWKSRARRPNSGCWMSAGSGCHATLRCGLMWMTMPASLCAGGCLWSMASRWPSATATTRRTSYRHLRRAGSGSPAGRTA